MLKTIGALLSCGLLSGCGPLHEAFMPVHAKFNQAFPPGAELRIAQENLLALLQQDAAGRADFEKFHDDALQLRALTCAQGLSIGRFSTVASVQTLPVDNDCLQEQDAHLLQHIGIRQIGVRIAQPPLRPFAPLGLPAMLVVDGSLEVTSVHAASAAGVMVLHGSRSEHVSVEVPGGKKISALPDLQLATNGASLSPNGRVVAFSTIGRGVTFVDTQTGGRLWETKEIGQVYAWMPGISAILAGAPEGGALKLINVQSGKIESGVYGMSDRGWGLALGGDPARVLVGARSEFALVEYRRSASGLTGSVVREYRIKGYGAGSVPPTTMLAGKALLFVSGQELVLVDLDTGEQTSWQTGEYFGSRFAKLSETTVLVDISGSSESRPKSWVFDISQGTLAPVQSEVGKSGSLSELAGRKGFMRRGYRQVWLGDTVETGSASPLETVTGAINLERQVAKLEALTREETREYEVDDRLEAYERLRRRRALIPSDSAPAAPPEPMRANPMFAALARDAQVQAIGVYEGEGSSHGYGRESVPGTVEVQVRRSSKPTVLVVSSYEPVTWKITLQPGALLAAVLISGYKTSKVVGAGSAPQVDIGSNYCYEQGKCGRLDAEVRRWIGKPVDVLQGRYRGGSFTIGGI